MKDVRVVIQNPQDNGQSYIIITCFLSLSRLLSIGQIFRRSGDIGILNKCPSDVPKNIPMVRDSLLNHESGEKSHQKTEETQDDRFKETLFFSQEHPDSQGFQEKSRQKKVSA